MNWYKTSQQEEWNWPKFLAYFGITVIGGLASMKGIGALDIQQELLANPQKVVQEAEVVKQEQEQQELSNQKEQTSTVKPNEVIYDMLVRHEGMRTVVYPDSLGIPTIGIGFNLEKPGAAQRLSGLGVDINDVLNGKELTDGQIYHLFGEDVQTATTDAQSFLDNFEQQPEEVKNVLIDMAFNLGRNRLSGFKKFRAALLQNNYKKAAAEMIDSQWYHQVGDRSKELVSIMKGI